MIQRQRIRLGDVLVQKQVITPEDLQKALKEQKNRGTKLGETLMSMGLVSEQQMVEVLTEMLHIDYVELRNVKLDKEAVYLINETIAKQYNLIPIGFDKNNPNILMVAMSDPMDFIAMDDISIITNRRIQPVLSTSSQIAYEIDRYFGRQSVMEVAERYKKEFGEEETPEDKNDKREDQAETDNSPIVIMVRSIMEQAVHQRASDIHFEPTRDGIRIRFRVDGDLIEAMKHDATIQAAITARVKIISGMDISEKRKPQDGRTTLVVDHVEYDVRVSSIPTVYGEKLVMRFNNKESLTRDKRELGLEGDDLAKFDDMLAHRHGLILVTGPTGSGKSTTLYTALSQLNRENVNIVTVEDPVEANVDGVNQVQVNPKIDMTFAGALRSILRQDPDIIMIGEIRDSETAEIAIQASITGHLVVSTLHTNSTEASVARLMNMGIEPYLIADALVGVVAQRLVRRLCSCKREREATAEEKEELGVPAAQPLMIYERVGCQRCSHTGYFGRIAVYEMLPSSPEIHTAIARMRPSSEIKQIALDQGMTTLHDQAVRLVREGITSMDELRKIAYEE
ncbi:MAG: Flp pilus assembly complex ATPase component TadA [Lachnospiraceae bacterium]|nr:Flp pilus assembly complex ATPase component TadA [Lachnospiraceae bacterium]